MFFVTIAYLRSPIRDTHHFYFTATFSASFSATFSATFGATFSASATFSAGSPSPRGVMEGKRLGDVSKVRELNIHYVLT